MGTDYSYALVRTVDETLGMHGVHGRVARVAQLPERVQKRCRISIARSEIPAHSTGSGIGTPQGQVENAGIGTPAA